MWRDANVNKQNSAGIISKDRLAEISIKFDKNGDGVLSKDEVKKAFEYLGSRWPGYRTAEGIKQADANNDGVVDLKLELSALVDYTYKIHYDAPTKELPAC